MTDRRIRRAALVARRVVVALATVALVAFASTSATARTPSTAPVDGSSPSPSSPAVNAAFSGDFETGSISQWTGAQCANTGLPSSAGFGTVVVESRIVGQGKFSARFDAPVADDKNSCELLSSRNIGLDTDDYYGLMVRLPKNWRGEPSPAGWGLSLAQFNFENIWGTPVQLVAHANHISLILQSGLCVKDVRCTYSTGLSGNVKPAFAVPAPLKLGAWYELIVHVHWATDSSGIVEVWHRLQGKAQWTKTVSLRGYPTVQWTEERLSTLGFSGTYDKIGPYRGRASFPLTIWEDAFVRTTSFAAAARSLPIAPVHEPR